MLIPGETLGREPTDGGLTLGRETDGRLMSGLEPALMLGLLLTPIEGRETEEPKFDEGRLLTLGSEGRLDGAEMLGRDMPPPPGRDMLGLGRDMLGLGRETLGLGRDMPPPGRPPPPIPIDGRAAAPRPPPPSRPKALGITTKLNTPISRMPKGTYLVRRIMILTVVFLECDDLSPLWLNCLCELRTLAPC